MVEWKKMWELTAWDKKFQGVEKYMQKTIIPYKYLLAKELFALSAPNGNIKLLSTGVQEGWTTEELAGDLISEGEVVTIPWGKSPGAQNPVKYYKGKFVTGDNRIATSIDTNILNNKYLYYWMYSNSNMIETFYRGAGIQHPSMFKVLNMSIPLPPLSEQNRIVGILDTFTESIENLRKQISERKKQYEHYRDQLLDLEGKPGVEMKALGEICIIKNGYTPSTKNPEFWENGNIPWFTLEDIRKNGRILYDAIKHITEKGVKRGGLFPKDSIIVSTTATIGEYAIIRTNFLCNQQISCISIKENELLDIKYLYYLGDNIGKWCKKNINGGGSLLIVSTSKLQKKAIPIPPLDEQKRIVSILDQFEASITNLEAQFSLRQKQYEYYRNMLLTFDE